MKKSILLLNITTFTSSATLTLASIANEYCPINMSALECTVFKQRNEVLDYKKISEENTSKIKTVIYQLNSQKYPIHINTNKNVWIHNISLFIPNNYIKKNTPFLYIDGGNLNRKKISKINFSNIAMEIKSIVIVIDLVPNQPISFPNKADLSEDQLIAYTWKLYLENSSENKLLPLQLPMALASIKAMDMLQQNSELSHYNMDSFILGGASKRGWAAWLTAIADSRIKAIIPSSIDIFNTKKLFENITKSYAQNWPIALYPYYQEKMYQFTNHPDFTSLMNIVDPLAYLETPNKERLSIPKLILSSSGDDFFPPDSIYENQEFLPGKTYFRYIPNSNHFISSTVLESSITTFINRVNSQDKIKLLHLNFTEKLNGDIQEINIEPREDIDSIKLWKANNILERDFRFACGIRYIETKYSAPIDKELKIIIETPSKGWSSSFIEVTYKDGFVQTTPAIVLPRNIYPKYISTEKTGACRVLPLN